MKRIYKYIFASIAVFFIICFLVILFINKGEGKVLCNEVEDGYEIVLYDSWERVVDTVWLPEEPGIYNVTDELVEIVVSVGSPAHYIFYFDKRNNRVSDAFFNPILVDNRYAAYMDYEPERVLIIRDLFDEGKFYKKIVRDFSMVTDLNSAMSIEIVDKKYFLIEYLKGEDYEVVKEVIPMND